MPNWCMTNVTIQTYDKDKAARFGELLTKWTSKDYRENGFFNHTWLGNIVGNSGLATYDETKGSFFTKDGVNIRCRGSLDDWTVDDDCIHLFMSHAWSPMLRMWRLLVDKYFPEADITFNAEEPGCELYATNDPYYVGTFYVDAWEVPDEYKEKMKSLDMNGSDISEYGETEENLRKLLQALLDTSETDIDKLINESNDKLHWLYIHEWTHAEVMDFDE